MFNTYTGVKDKFVGPHILKNLASDVSYNFLTPKN